MLGEILPKPHVISIGFVRNVALRPVKEGVDKVHDPRICTVGVLRGNGCKFMKFLQSEFLVLVARDETNLLATEGDHPPADVFAEPNAIGKRPAKCIYDVSGAVVNMSA